MTARMRSLPAGETPGPRELPGGALDQEHGQVPRRAQMPIEREGAGVVERAAQRDAGVAG